MTTICEVLTATTEEYEYVLSLDNVDKDDRKDIRQWLPLANASGLHKAILIESEIHVASVSDLVMIALRWF